MMQSKTSSRFALDATHSCIGERIKDRFLMGPGTTSYSTAFTLPPYNEKETTQGRVHVLYCFSMTTQQ
jgi:hypothetical protein